MTKQTGFYFRCAAQELQELRAKAKERGQSTAKFILDKCIYNASDNVYTSDPPKEDVYTKPKQAKPAPVKGSGENKTAKGVDVAAIVAQYKAKKTRSN